MQSLKSHEASGKRVVSAEADLSVRMGPLLPSATGQPAEDEAVARAPTE